ncbi:MAG: hypothetical protein JNL40_11730 [Cyclobacteriaceae bacterium]|nr:hypothetical protein [Cyclobacteriaceae bacterium]
MRRLAAIFMLVLHLGLFTEMDELFSLPLLVEHYLEHRSKVPEMSFFDFLAMHYKTDVAHDSTDMKLPFKDCGNSFASPTFTSPEQKLSLTTFSLAQVPVFGSTYIAFIPSSGLEEIFQPPRA